MYWQNLHRLMLLCAAGITYAPDWERSNGQSV